MKSKILQIITECLTDLNEELENESLNIITEDTKIFGSNGALDSLALVSLIADLEEKISQEFDKDIVLADEKAMSQKTSPFRNVASLSEYIYLLIKD